MVWVPYQGYASFGLLFNDGSGHFTQSEQQNYFDTFFSDNGSSNVALKAAVGDIDNDGDLDALTVGYAKDVEIKAGKFTPMTLTIWLNDGTGHFTDSHKNINGFFGTKVQVADFNKDGLKDIMVGNQIWMGGVNQENSNLCDWAERKFPVFFPRRTADLISGKWEYRYYPSVKTYIGVDTDQDKIYVLGDVFKGLKEVGNKQEMIKMSKQPRVSMF